jgi:hypothetical protein
VNQQWLVVETNLTLNSGELVRHGDQGFAVALALVCWQREDAGQVVALLRFLLFREVADNMGTPVITLTQQIE